MHELELSKKDKLDILSKAIEFLNKESLYCSYSCGICNAIKVELKRKFPEDEMFTNLHYFLCRDIPIFIPEFTRETAVRLSSIYNFQSPTMENFWWYRNDYTTRIHFLKALIVELITD